MQHNRNTRWNLLCFVFANCDVNPESPRITEPGFAWATRLVPDRIILLTSSAQPQAGAPVAVSFDDTNTGSREGAEVAELYVGDPHSSVPRPPKELKGFAKVNLRPGETKRVTLLLDRRAFSFYDLTRKDWNAEPGPFTILVGGSSADIALQGKFLLQP